MSYLPFHVGGELFFCPSPRMCHNIHLFQEEEDEEDYYDDDEDEEHSYDDEDDEGEQSFHAKNFVSYMQKIIFIA